MQDVQMLALFVVQAVPVAAHQVFFLLAFTTIPLRFAMPMLYCARPRVSLARTSVPVAAFNIQS